VIERLLDADGVLHLAWGALDLGDPAQPAMGVVHAMRPDAGDAVAEFSVGVVDAYHGLGIGRLLTATLLLDAAGGRLEAFRAHVLSENDAARSFIKRLGGVHVAQDGPQAEYLLEVAPALARLREESRPGGLAAIFAHFDAREVAAGGGGG
jgi:ribosomal protein S18 acetylase RimI-like enzyme